jgi:TonB family protein
MREQLDALTGLASDERLAANGEDAGKADAPDAQPDILASAVTATSGGIDTRGLGANAGGGRSVRETRRITGSTPHELAQQGVQEKRTAQMLQQVFEQNKSRIHMLYERARRERPGLQGKLVLEITIAPGGQVIEVRVVSSDLDHPALEQRIAARVRQFTFPPSAQGAVTRRYPIEFLPS